MKNIKKTAYKTKKFVCDVIFGVYFDFNMILNYKRDFVTILVVTNFLFVFFRQQRLLNEKIYIRNVRFQTQCGRSRSGI